MYRLRQQVKGLLADTAGAASAASAAVDAGFARRIGEAHALRAAMAERLRQVEAEAAAAAAEQESLRRSLEGKRWGGVCGRWGRFGVRGASATRSLRWRGA